MKFTKMHGCGNDYVYVNLFEEKIADPAKVSIAVSDRHFGIGSDGLITIGPSDIADFRMRIYNADGSEAEMCGNGIRCVAKYVYDHKMTDKKEITIETGAGVKTLQLTVADGKVSLVRVDMGEPILKPDLIPVDASGEQVVDAPIEVEGREWKMTCVSMGNPHAVIFVEDTEHFELEKYGFNIGSPISTRTSETLPSATVSCNVRSEERRVGTRIRGEITCTNSVLVRFGNRG